MKVVAPKFDFSVLRRLRQQKDLTLADLAKASKVSPAVISKLERNQQAPGIDTLYRLGRAFGMSATELLSLAESPLAHRNREDSHRSGGFTFRRIRYSNVLALRGTASAGAMMRKAGAQRWRSLSTARSLLTSTWAPAVAASSMNFWSSESLQRGRSNFGSPSSTLAGRTPCTSATLGLRFRKARDRG